MDIPRVVKLENAPLLSSRLRRKNTRVHSHQTEGVCSTGLLSIDNPID